jgi:DNA-binding PadR family transcriptional regulator
MHSNDAQLLVLTVLADSEKHGYAINTAIKELTGARLGPGSLYGALARLEARQLIESSAEPVDAKDRQRIVRITEAGREALRAELEQMARVAQAGLRALRTARA